MESFLPSPIIYPPHIGERTLVPKPIDPKDTLLNKIIAITNGKASDTNKIFFIKKAIQESQTALCQIHHQAEE